MNSCSTPSVNLNGWPPASVAAEVQRRAAPQQSGIPDTEGICAESERGKRLWKRRCGEKYKPLFYSAWKFRKRRGIPTIKTLQETSCTFRISFWLRSVGR